MPEAATVTAAPTRDATKEIGFGDAIREAIAEEMRRDPTVVLMGEDVAEAGTTFKVLKGHPIHSFMGSEDDGPDRDLFLHSMTSFNQSCDAGGQNPSNSFPSNDCLCQIECRKPVAKGTQCR